MAWVCNDVYLNIKLLITVPNFWALYDLMSDWNIVVSVKLTNLRIKAFYTFRWSCDQRDSVYLPQSFPKFGLAFFSTSFTYSCQLKAWYFPRFIKDYDGGLLMECKIDPKLPYTDLSSMIRQQRKVTHWIYLNSDEILSWAFKFFSFWSFFFPKLSLLSFNFMEI